MKRVWWIAAGAVAGVLALVVLLYLFLPARHVQDAEVSGVQFGSKVWSGTIHVTGDTRFLPGVHLTIEPGTHVLIDKAPDGDLAATPWTKNADAYIKDHNDPTGHVGYARSHYEISGKITAVGTREAPIVFTSAQERPEYADWDQLYLRGGSHLAYVEVAYAHNGINVHGDGVVLENVTAHDSLWSCIDVFSADSRIVNATVYHCWHQGVGYKHPGDHVLEGSFIHDTNAGINCENGGLPRLRENRLEASFLAPPCGALGGITQVDRPTDVPGGTYDGKLIYPAQPAAG